MESKNENKTSNKTGTSKGPKEFATGKNKKGEQICFTCGNTEHLANYYKKDDKRDTEKKKPSVRIIKIASRKKGHERMAEQTWDLSDSLENNHISKGTPSYGSQLETYGTKRKGLTRPHRPLIELQRTLHYSLENKHWFRLPAGDDPIEHYVRVELVKVFQKQLIKGPKVYALIEYNPLFNKTSGIDSKDSLPSNLKEYADVFSPQNAEKLALNCEGVNLAIKIQEGQELPYSPLYLLSQAELEVLQCYLQENLKKGFIRPSKSPAASLILFVPKKDAAFQGYINQALRGLVDDFCIVYLDDILIFSKTKEEHTEHLRLVYEWLRTAKLYTKPLKCQFYQNEMEFLGFIINDQGVKIDPERV
ncbi:retrovirus polyprotein, putative [Talaromyces stipitatus ATCC 10500]|uniref:Retrovirus polyprotein, putative n=1 Tax=Talaromyces stipitatus (strain ATCC 10500 / CBS 375.48 / QM 6759 / NRRL 1006) TaxID=441959 RepID=B8MLX3_TALSN|nr:retrovirus polyprotein, putative [Talaromyces stipitatus ATCC 10500]EED13485.1 retrovirus polyprotein, putative [Talaromyces stipitatus ATCC 10500]